MVSSPTTQVHEDKPGQHHKELNPYWKDGGSGLPDVPTQTRTNMEGRSWILRSYKRALEKVGKDGKTFEEIAQKQWGSVDKIHSLLRSVGIDPFLPDATSSQARNSSTDDTFSSDVNFQSKYHISRPRAKGGAGRPSDFLRPGDETIVEVSYSEKDSSLAVSEPPTEPSVAETEVAPVPAAPSEDCVTDAMINSTSAKLIKAELLGNKEKIERLKSELDDLRSRKKSQASLQRDQQNNTREKTVLLTNTDRFGRTRPAAYPETGRGRHSSKGKSRRNVGDDEYSLASLVKMEHTTTADDTYEAIAKMASKFVRSSTDDVVDDVVDRKTKSNPSKDEAQAKLKLLTESRRMEEMMDTCKLCLNGSNFKKELLVAVGINVYLSVPPYQSLTDGHCVLAPLEHLACSLHMDENVWSEVKVFQKGLARMFSDRNKDVIFTECYTSAAKRSHMSIDCIPVPKDEGSMAPMYFKKAILESDSEWAHNRKLIDTRQKGLKNSLPVGLPYFFVDFNNEGGFAHVIEDSSLFPRYFAKEVIGGLIDAEPRLWLKPRYESYEQRKQKALELTDMWKPYNWTETLK